MKLLVELPSPRRITADMEEAKRLLKRHRSSDKVTAIVASAVTSQGVVMLAEEELEISELAKQMLEQRREIERIDKELRELLKRDPVAVRLAALVGPTTAMVLAADLGDRIGLVGGLFYGLNFGMGGIAAAVLGGMADRIGIERVYQLCSFLPLVGLLTVFLPRIKEDRATRAA